MRKLKKETEIKKSKNRNLLTMVVCAVFVLASILRILVANRSIEYSDKLHKLEITANKLKAENEKLAQQLESESSLSKIKQKAKEMGFISISSVVYVSISTPLALRLP